MIKNLFLDIFLRRRRFFWLLIGVSLLVHGTAFSSPLEHSFSSDKRLTADFQLTDVAKRLLVEPQLVFSEQADFVKKLRRSWKHKRKLLYERYISIIGVNGILAGIHSLWPTCHSQAHDLGKVIFAHVRDLQQSIALCANACSAGCLHGVFMEGFQHLKDPSDNGFDLSALKNVATDFCDNDPYNLTSLSPGNCYHGVGHGLMAAADYEVSKALLGCKAFKEVHRVYYCATGAFMEYVNEHDTKDALSKDLLYPCTKQVFPAACARYKMVHVARRHYLSGKTTEALKQECRKFKGAVRLGCFHGLGNAHLASLYTGQISLSDLCLGLQDDETSVCIDGAIERIAQYYQSRADQICQELDAENRALCLAGVKRKMYDMNKDLTKYLGQSNWTSFE